MKGVFKHKANADLGDLTSLLVINAARVRFSPPLLPHILYSIRKQCYLHYNSASETSTGSITQGRGALLPPF